MSDRPWHADGAIDAADQALLADLREALNWADPVPEALLEAARASFTWRTIDAELAELVADSAMEAAAVRSAAALATRLLTFTADDITVVVEIEEAGAARRLLGQVLLPRAGSIEVRRPGGRQSTAVDELGRFRAEDVPAGPMQLACRFADGTALVTDWVTI